MSGGTVTAPADLVLHAVVPGLTKTPMAVTPLTEMAFGIASASSGGLTVANIDAANSAVSAAMLDGAPVLSTIPINLANFKTATVAQQAQAKLLTAMALSAGEKFAAGPSCTACTDGDYNARVVCMVGGLKSLLVPGASNTFTFATQAAYLATAYEELNLGLTTVQGGQSPAAIGLTAQTTAEKSFAVSLTAGWGRFSVSLTADSVQPQQATVLGADLTFTRHW